MAQTPSTAEEVQRLDKWLWAARFFKTRSAATSAINGGKVHLNGQRIKAAHRVRPGMNLTVSRGVMNWEIVILALNNQRRPAEEARQLYEETAASIALRTNQAARQRQTEQRRNQRLGRPDKHQRRELTRIKQHPEEN